jgi:hypothetical protein
MSLFFRRGITKIYYAPTIAIKATPTVAEMAAGTDLTPKVAAVQGFTYENQPIDTPNMAESFTTTIPGPDTSAASVLTFNEDKTTNALRTTLTKGTTGYIVIFPGGIAGSAPAAADKCDVWPIITTGKPRDITLDANPATYRVGFTPTATPVEDGAVIA